MRGYQARATILFRDLRRIGGSACGGVRAFRLLMLQNAAPPILLQSGRPSVPAAITDSRHRGTIFAVHSLE